jgi:RNA polymerase sigma factor (sigma-70 family)
VFISARAGRAFILQRDELFTVRFDDVALRPSNEFEFRNFLRLYPDVLEQDSGSQALHHLQSTLRERWQEVQCVELLVGLMDTTLATTLRRDIALTAERLLRVDNVQQLVTAVFLNIPPPADADITGAARILRNAKFRKNDAPVRVLTLFELVMEHAPEIHRLRDSWTIAVRKLSDTRLRETAEVFIDEYHLIGNLIVAQRSSTVGELLDTTDARLSRTSQLREFINTWLSSEVAGLDETEVYNLYVLYYNRVVKYLRRSFGFSYEDASDIAQDVFVTLFRHLKPVAAPWPFIKVTAHHRAVNAIRSQSLARRSGPSPDIPDSVLADIWTGQPPPSPEAAASEREQVAKLREAIETLPDALRACVLLRIEGRSYEEIAATLEVSVDAVRTRLRDAKKLLQRRIAL